MRCRGLLQVRTMSRGGEETLLAPQPSLVSFLFLLLCPRGVTPLPEEAVWVVTENTCCYQLHARGLVAPGCDPSHTSLQWLLPPSRNSSNYRRAEGLLVCQWTLLSLCSVPRRFCKCLFCSLLYSQITPAT